MAFGVVIIGDEILSGRRIDKHLPKVIELLGARAFARLGGIHRRRSGAHHEHVAAHVRVGRYRVLDGQHLCQAGRPHASMRGTALGVLLELHPEAKTLIQDRIREMHPASATAPVDLNSPENLHQLNMGTYPQGASIIPNGYNKIPGFSIRQHHFVPGFPVMAWPMIEWVLDTRTRICITLCRTRKSLCWCSSCRSRASRRSW